MGVTGAFTATQAFAIGATTSVVSGMAVRANSSILVEGLNPNPNPYHNSPLDSLNTAINHALDPRMVAIDTLMGGVSGVLWYKINEAINKEQTESCESSNKGEADAWKRNLKDTGELNGSDFENLKDNGTIKVNQAGSDRPLKRDPNSFFRTENGEHTCNYNSLENVVAISHLLCPDFIQIGEYVFVSEFFKEDGEGAINKVEKLEERFGKNKKI